MRCKVLNTCKMVQPCWQKHQEERHHRRTCKGWTLYRPATIWCWLPCWVGVGMIKMMIHFCEHDYIITRNDFHRLSPKYASRLKKVCLHCPEPGRFVVVVDNLSRFCNRKQHFFFLNHTWEPPSPPQVPSQEKDREERKRQTIQIHCQAARVHLYEWWWFRKRQQW